MPEQYRGLWLEYFLTMLLESGLKSVGTARLAIASSSSGHVVGGDYGRFPHMSVWTQITARSDVPHNRGAELDCRAAGRSRNRDD